MNTDKIDNELYSENNLRAFLAEQLRVFKTERAKKLVTPKKKSSKEDQIVWLSFGFVLRAAMEIDLQFFKCCCLRQELNTQWMLEYLGDEGVLVGAYAFRLADYLWWKMSANDVESTGGFYSGYDGDRNPIDVDPSTLTPKNCFEEFFVQDSQCVIEHSNDMIQELTTHYTEGGDDGHLLFISYLSDLISVYPHESLAIYSAIHCLLEDLSIQQAMTECIEDCEACINTQTKQGCDSDSSRRMLVADLILKKAEDLGLVKA